MGEGWREKRSRQDWGGIVWGWRKLRKDPGALKVGEGRHPRGLGCQDRWIPGRDMGVVSKRDPHTHLELQKEQEREGNN